MSFLKQKAKAAWLKYGDDNFNIYFTKTLDRGESRTLSMEHIIWQGFGRIQVRR